MKIIRTNIKQAKPIVIVIVILPFITFFPPFCSAIYRRQHISGDYGQDYLPDMPESAVMGHPAGDEHHEGELVRYRIHAAPGKGVASQNSP